MTLIEKLSTMAAGCRLDGETGMAELLEEAITALSPRATSIVPEGFYCEGEQLRSSLKCTYQCKDCRTEVERAEADASAVSHTEPTEYQHKPQHYPTAPSSTAPKVTPLGFPRYTRWPAHDMRIKNGDDFAGDAWVFWTAVGHDPNTEAPLSARRQAVLPPDDHTGDPEPLG